MTRIDANGMISRGEFEFSSGAPTNSAKSLTIRVWCRCCRRVRGHAGGTDRSVPSPFRPQQVRVPLLLLGAGAVSNTVATSRGQRIAYRARAEEQKWHADLLWPKWAGYTSGLCPRRAPEPVGSNGTKLEL